MNPGELFGARLATGLDASTATAVARGGKISIQHVAADFFGSIIGNSLVEASTGVNNPSSANYVNEMDRTSDAYNPAFEHGHRNGSDLQSDAAHAQRLRNEVYGFAGVMTGSGMSLREDGGSGLSFNGLRAAEPIDRRFDFEAGPPRPGMKYTDHAGWQGDVEGNAPGALNRPTADAGNWLKDQWQGVRQGWKRDYWSVLQGERPISYDLARGTRGVVGSLIGADSMDNARAAWNKGDYVRAPLYAMHAVGEAGLTALTLGEYQLMKQTAGMLVSERMAVSMFPGAEATAAARATYRIVPAQLEPGVEFAMVNGRRVEPLQFGTVYHGTDNRTMGLAGSTTADDVAQRIYQNGLPARGTNVDLIDHAINNAPDRAFRGTTLQPISQERNAGAAYWAGENGVLVEIKNVRGYDVNAALEGRVPRPGGFGGNPRFGEQEIAVPGTIRPEQINRVGVVVVRPNGQLGVEWMQRSGR
jgi:hypothetical protein